MENWTSGYTHAELEEAQERFGLRFPPDLVQLFLEKRPVLGYDWRIDIEPIGWALRQPLEGLLFDLEHNDLWWPEWGERPPLPSERAEVLTAVVEAAPRLIPILGHRYIPEEPHAPGNPVFSVSQSDTIYYGRDLEDYFQREFFPQFPGTNVSGHIRRIRFWSDLVDRNPLLQASLN